MGNNPKDMSMHCWMFGFCNSEPFINYLTSGCIHILHRLDPAFRSQHPIYYITVSNSKTVAILMIFCFSNAVLNDFNKMPVYVHSTCY